MGIIKNKPSKSRLGDTRNEKYSPGEIDDLADQLLSWMDIESNIWLKDFCVYHRLKGEDLPKFVRKSERFKNALNLAKDIQESKLVYGGLHRKLDAGLVKFSLMNHHGWVNKNETRVSGDSKDPVAIFLSEIDGNSKELLPEELEEKND